MLKRSKKPFSNAENWFYFSASISWTLIPEYISCRLLYYLEPLTTSTTILQLLIGVAEKSLKLFLIMQNESEEAIYDSKKIGHNIEKLREECSKYNPIFNDNDIMEFTTDLNDESGKLQQFIKYGSEKTTNGFNSNIIRLIPVMDKIFIKSILLLPESKKSLIVFTSTLKNLLAKSRFDQSNNPKLLINALMYQNYYIDEFIKYCNILDATHRKGLNSE